MVRVLTSSKYKDFYIDEDQKGEVVYTPNYNDLAYIMKSINSKYKFAIGINYYFEENNYHLSMDIEPLLSIRIQYFHNIRDEVAYSEEIDHIDEMLSKNLDRLNSIMLKIRQKYTDYGSGYRLDKEEYRKLNEIMIDILPSMYTFFNIIDMDEYDIDKLKKKYEMQHQLMI